MIVHEVKKSSAHKKRKRSLHYGMRCPLLALSDMRQRTANVRFWGYSGHR